MKIFNLTSRKQKLKRRKQKLSEKFISDYTWRKFSSEQLAKLNPSIDFKTVDTIYEIEWCNGIAKSLDRLKDLIYIEKISKISDLNNTIEKGQHEFAFEPIGSYIRTFIWTKKDHIFFLQLVAGSFETNNDKIIFNQDIKINDITEIKQRKLIYPI